jgi:hypothetical protein
MERTGAVDFCRDNDTIFCGGSLNSGPRVIRGLLGDTDVMYMTFMHAG